MYGGGNECDVRYGENPFPYGSNYDLGIDIEERQLGAPSDVPLIYGDMHPTEPEEGEEGLNSYLTITLHPNFYGIQSDSSWVTNRVYIKMSIMPKYATSNLVSVKKYKDYMGVVSSDGLLAVFPKYWSGELRDPFLSETDIVFDSIVSSEAYSQDIINGIKFGKPIYYFLWNGLADALDGPAKRFLFEPTDSEDVIQFSFGVFLQDGPEDSYLTPIPAIYAELDPMMRVSLATILGVRRGEANPDYPLGTVTIRHKLEILSGIADVVSGAWNPLDTTVTGTSLAMSPNQTFMSDVLPHPSGGGWFFPRWYDPELGPTEPGQNHEAFRVESSSQVYKLDQFLSFAGNPPYEHSMCWYRAKSVVPQQEEDEDPTISDISENLELSVSATKIDPGVSTNLEGDTIYELGSSTLATATTDYLGRYVVTGYRASEFRAAIMDVALVDSRQVPDGLIKGDVLTWDADSQEWVPASQKQTELPDGNVDKDVLTWDEDSQEWVPEQPEQGHMPPGEDQNTMFYDGEVDNGEGEDPGAWVANETLLWQKGKAVSGENKGNRLLFDFKNLVTRPWDADMPGIAFKHPTGATSGLFANIESGANAGDRLDMGFGGDGGGNFEIYGNDHNTRSGQFRIIVGENGHVEIKVHQGGTSWKTVAGISKHGRFFCGFNDTGFPGGNETYGTYPAPQHPLQVYDEEEHDSQVVAHITKDGVLKLRAKIGEIERDVTIDLSDISEENEEAISVKLRETYVLEMEDGKLVGKKRMILCSESYGDAEEVGSANIEDGTTGQILRWTDGEWKPTSLVEQNVVTDAEYAAGEFSITTEKLECLVKSGGNATKTVFNTVEGAGKMNTGTTVGHTHD